MSLCMGCMTEKGDSAICPSCGLNEEELAGSNNVFLKPGTTLRDRYLLGIALGQGGFGITYIGYDNVLNTKVAIKEFYPSDIAGRVSADGTVSAYTSADDEYGRGKERFLEEARTLAKFSDHPCIVGVKDCFEMNNTAYMVMEFLEGISLKEYLKRKGGRLSAEESISLLTPVMDALRAVHKMGIIHRDISPDNIFVTTDGRVRLIDFGAARQSIGGQKSLSVMLKPGYAPEEQYRTRGNQGPWTDVYALTATLYRMITGSVPPDSLERVMDDTLEIPMNLPQYIQSALRIGLAVRAAERFSSIEQLQAALKGEASEKYTPTGRTPMETDVLGKNKEKNENKQNNKKLIVLLVTACVLVITAVTMLVITLNDSDKDNKVEEIVVENKSMEVKVDADGNLVDENGNIVMSADEYSKATGNNEENSEKVNQNEKEVKEEPVKEVENILYNLYVVNCQENISLRTQPNTSASVITTIPLGSKVGLIDSAENGFLKIKYNGYIGYSLGSYLAEDFSENDGTVKSYMYVAYCNEFISLRMKPVQSAPLLKEIPLGSKVGFIEQTTSDFAKVKYDGIVGYVMSQYLSNEAPRENNYESTNSSQQSQGNPDFMNVVNCNEWISLRVSPSTSAERIAQIPLGAMVTFLGSASNGFYKVEYNGQIGYALAQYLSY